MQIYEQDDQVEDWHKYASGAVMDFLVQKIGAVMESTVKVN